MVGKSQFYIIESEGKLDTLEALGGDDVKAQDVVLIFPSKAEAHTAGKQTLYGKKEGVGLSELVSASGDKGYPSLGLPLQGLDAVGKDIEGINDAPEPAKAAIKDIWRAVGAGYNICLPVNDLDAKDVGDALGWGEEAKAHPWLADFYRRELKALQEFYKLNEAERLEEIKKEAYASVRDAYQEGVNSLKSKPEEGFFAKAGTTIKGKPSDETSLRHLLSAGKPSEIIRAMKAEGYSCIEPPNERKLTFKKGNKLEFTVTKDRVSAENTKHLTLSEKEALAKSMVKAFFEGMINVPEEKRIFSLNSADPELKKAIEAEASKPEYKLFSGKEAYEAHKAAMMRPADPAEPSVDPPVGPGPAPVPGK